MTSARSGRPRSCATPAMVTALVTCSVVRVSEEPDTRQRSDTVGPPVLSVSQASPTRTAAATSRAGHQAPMRLIRLPVLRFRAGARAPAGPPLPRGRAPLGGAPPGPPPSPAAPRRRTPASGPPSGGPGGVDGGPCGGADRRVKGRRPPNPGSPGSPREPLGAVAGRVTSLACAAPLLPRSPHV